MHDGFAFALAESYRDSILLSGDEALRALATRHAMEVHGVLWVLDELHANRFTRTAAILGVLRAFLDDSTVRLPRREITAYIRRYETLK
ncbi:MAG: hypothetical protein ACLQU1_38375 [Bryobacteraceae bacterium]